MKTGNMPLVFMFVCYCFVIYQGFCHHIEHEEFIFEEGTYGVTRYRLLRDKYSRNDAHEICRLYGGHIVRLDHFEKLVHLAHLNFREWSWGLKHDFWVDLVIEPINQTLLRTSDCKVVDPSNEWTCLSSAFSITSDKLCLVSRHGGRCENKECSSDAMVLCETYETGTNCSYGSIMEFPVLSIHDETEAFCQTNCAAEQSCWSYTFSLTSATRGTCVLMFDASKQADPALQTLKTATKHCYVGEPVPAVDPTWSLEEDENAEPVYSCTAVSGNSSQKSQQNITNQNLVNIANQIDICSTKILTEYQTLTVIDTTTKDLTVVMTASPTTVVMTTEIPSTLVVTTTEVPSPVVTTIVSTEIATTIVEIPATVMRTIELPASNVTITVSPSIVPTTTVVSHDVVTTTAEVPTTVVITESPSVIVSTVAFTVATTSTVIVPTTVVSSEVETHATTVVLTTTVVATTWSSVSLEPAVLAEKLNNIIRNLTVAKKNTKAYQRSLVCAEDNRASAKTVGYLGIFLLVFPLAIMICLDIPSAVTRIRRLRRISDA